MAYDSHSAKFSTLVLLLRNVVLIINRLLFAEYFYIWGVSSVG